MFMSISLLSEGRGLRPSHGEMSGGERARARCVVLEAHPRADAHEVLPVGEMQLVGARLGGGEGDRAEMRDGVVQAHEHGLRQRYVHADAETVSAAGVVAV